MVIPTKVLNLDVHLKRKLKSYTIRCITKIEALGGTYSDSVSRKTTLLVSDTTSEKTNKAKKNGTKILSRAKFAEKLELAAFVVSTG